MKVLYVNHTGQVSGGEKSLLEILRALPSTVDPLVACPDGPLVDAVDELGVERVRITGTDGSLKLHPRHTPVAIARMTKAAAEVRSLGRRRAVDVVHANSIRAGLFCALAARTGGPPAVVHVRDRLPPSLVSRLTLRAIAQADTVVANSRYTAAGFTEAGVARRVTVLGNPVDLVRFDAETVDRDQARAALELTNNDFVATVLAQITPWKGQEDAIRAIDIVRRTHPQAKLLLVGSAKFVSKATRYDNRSYLAHLHRLVSERDLSDHVVFAGERDDVPSVLRATDALLVPSWQEPFGRSVIEAMAMRVPVIATSIGGPAEVIADGEDGLVAPPRAPRAWAAAISRLIESPVLRERLALNGWLRSRAFSADTHTASLAKLYEDVIGDSIAFSDQQVAAYGARKAEALTSASR